ncbi:MAG: ABC transporter ATP-binding protein [Acidimicrobiia bacterium]
MTRFGLEEVTVRLGGRTALDQVSLDAHSGQVAAVVGGDGAGKTTLGRVLVGLTRVSGGRVRRPGSNRVGYQPAGSGTWTDLTVSENLAFVASTYRIGQSEFKRRLDQLLETTGLTESRNRLGTHLSGGMRQKLGVAMALLPQPELLVLDEPTTGVDPVSRFELWRLISQAAAAGTAVVLTTTYLDEAERASTILALDQGHPLAYGDLEDIRSSVAGRIFAADHPVGWPYRWRRGSGWRMWSADATPPGADSIDPDLTDLLTAVAVAREAKGLR